MLMTDEPPAQPDRPAEPPSPAPKRGALPVRRQDVEDAEPYVPDRPDAGDPPQQ